MFTILLAATFLHRLSSVPLAYWLLWAGSIVLSIGLVVLLHTRWGQSQPLRKCAVLSLLVHALLACLAMTIRVVVGEGGGGTPGAPIRVRIVDEAGTDGSPLSFSEASPTEAAPELYAPPEPEPVEHAIAGDKPEPEPDAKVAEAAPPDEPPAEPPQEVKAEPPALAQATPVEIISEKEEADEAPDTQIAMSDDTDSPPSKVEQAKTPAPKIEPSPPATIVVETPRDAAAETTTPSNTRATPISQGTPTKSGAYAMRSAPGRLGLVELQGGSAQTEAAVVAALNWLARAQSADGRWDANLSGAGKEEYVLNQDRGGAGRNADTGITALALLAFLGAGHTHQQGDYQNTVHQGLVFLLRSQAADGSMFGEATQYAQMYCHSMATFALAEAQAMTGDARLQPAVSRAVEFCLRAQHPVTGGWRYRPSVDVGDTSQLGWQMMALASAERAGIEVPAITWTRVGRFLRSVRRGTYGGLASYRPDGPQSTSMTAEALYCRLLLQEKGFEQIDPTMAAEAMNSLLATLPAADRTNLYYWYYASLALHQQQQNGAQAAGAWKRWNEALTTALLATQLADGDNVGSWNTDTIWGGYGGRVYTTSLGTMCLEVYYRYAPTTEARPSIATRPEAQGMPR